MNYVVLMIVRYFHALKFCNYFIRYSCVDSEISEAVMESVMRQMFYLVEETVPFALCDDCVSSEMKKSIVTKLLSSDRPQSFVPMKPLFKQDILLGKLHDEPELSDFIGSRSWLVFDLLHVDVHWMEYAPDEWAEYPEYLRFQKLVRDIICVNDVAERNVQNVCKYAEYSQDEGRRDLVVSVVNYHRDCHDFSNLTKAELNTLT